MSANISSADYAAYMARRSSAPTPARRAKRGTGETAVAKREWCAAQRTSQTECEIVIPVYARNPVNRIAPHWAVEGAHRRKMRQIAAACLVGKVPPALPVVVTMTRCGRGTLDDDNLRPALKQIRDELALWLGADDADERIEWRYEQAKEREHAVRVTVEQRKAAPP